MENQNFMQYKVEFILGEEAYEVMVDIPECMGQREAIGMFCQAASREAGLKERWFAFTGKVDREFGHHGACFQTYLTEQSGHVFGEVWMTAF